MHVVTIDSGLTSGQKTNNTQKIIKHDTKTIPTDLLTNLTVGQPKHILGANKVIFAKS